MASTDASAVGRALVEFALRGSFPDEDVSSRSVGTQAFGPALESLAAARSKVEVCTSDMSHQVRT